MAQMFNDHARRVVVLSQEEAVTHKSSVIGPGHLLVGILGAEGSVAAETLKALGLDPGRIPAEVLKVPGRRKWRLWGNVPFAEESKEALNQALPEAQRFGHGFIGAEHLLLGLVHNEEGTAATVLNGLGISPKAVRERVHQSMAEPSQYTRE
ncbi:Clp protease N-terminal domain-containing protein [Nocardiopsis quinghaiensis]|uniref:Clp protease N-terminal domain-containing protein n=1 Tax=Nocardiopsis quinghaiensis TaxID=464995 RepID=UPI0012387691|nr:Clp protease N-terminal domain-containing protein [Nocardiopsis quinghaiensis]